MHGWWLLLQSIHCACAILGQVNDLLGNKFKSAVLSRLAGECVALLRAANGLNFGCKEVTAMQTPAASIGLRCSVPVAFTVCRMLGGCQHRRSKQAAGWCTWAARCG